MNQRELMLESRIKELTQQVEFWRRTAVKETQRATHLQSMVFAMHEAQKNKSGKSPGSTLLTLLACAGLGLAVGRAR
jgi:hypothetical protein